MHIQPKIDFTVSETRLDIDYDTWIIRELALALISATFIIACSLAVKDLNTFTRITKIRLPLLCYKIMLAASCLLGFRTLVFRPLVATAMKMYFIPMSIYPIKGYRDNLVEADYVPHETWDTYGDKRYYVWKAFDGKLIHGCLLSGEKTAPHSGEYIIMAWGNEHLYDVTPLTNYTQYLAQGYSILLYHPPGYGKSDGPRTPKSDFYALEAIMQYFQQPSVRPNTLHLQGMSIGSGVTCAISTKYQVDTLTLVVPLSSIEGVAQHIIDQKLPKYISAFIGYFFQSIVRDMVHYDNCAALKQSLCTQIRIEEGADDHMMTLGHGPSEAEKLFQVLQQDHKETIVETAEHTTRKVETETCRYVLVTHHGMGHRV